MSKEKVKFKNISSRTWFFSLNEAENDIEDIFGKIRASRAVYAFAICHNRDTKILEDGSVEPKQRHWHFFINYENPTKLSVIAHLCQLEKENYHLVQKMEKTAKGCCRYLIHSENPEKVQYDRSEIVPLRGTLEDWDRISDGTTSILNGDYDKFPWFGNFEEKGYSEQYQIVYSSVGNFELRNKLLKKLKECQENYIRYLSLSKHNRDIKVYFISGPTGSGKTTFAKLQAERLGKTYSISSSSNDPMQDYGGEDYFILDDLRDNAFELEDLLKLLDPNTASTAKSRFVNKLFYGDCIFITSSVPLSKWYPSRSLVDKQQLYRRFSGYIECRREGGDFVARSWYPTNDEKVVDKRGNPQGVESSCAFTDLSRNMPLTPEEVYGDLGFDIADINKKVEEEKKRFEEHTKELMKIVREDKGPELPF